jgi:hypothetical protein
MTIESKELYASPNGDVWKLLSDSESGRMFVRHHANLSAGGKITDTEVDQFLRTSGESPEKQALLLALPDEVKNQPVILDERRGMIAQKKTDLRRLLADVQADQQLLREKQAELETQMLAAPAANWEEAAEKARYLIVLFAGTPAAEDPRRQKLITAVLEDFDRLSGH